jgi:predicted dehydrogenase
MSTKIALIGAGFIADYHARGLQKLEGVEIVAVVAKEMEEATEFANRYGIKETYTDISSVISNPDIDGVIIGTPNIFHAPYAIEALNKGKNVFLEKPMAMNTEEGEKVAEASKANNKIVMVGHMWRFDAEADYLKKVVASGKLGKIVKTKGYGIHVNWGPEGWFTQKRLSGGGALADMGVHAIDTIRYILGDPEPVEVYAKIGTYYGDYDVDDSGIIMITWDNGTTSVIESGWWHPHMDGPEAGSQLFGTKGYASLFPTKLKLNVEGFTGEFEPELPEKEDHCDQSIYDRQMEHYVDCIRKSTPPVNGIPEGLTVLKIVDAAYKSSESCQVVKM